MQYCHPIEEREVSPGRRKIHHAAGMTSLALRRRVGLTRQSFTLYHLEDSKFAEVWDLLDTNAIVRQIREGESFD
jgi:hypothetical protein